MKSAWSAIAMALAWLLGGRAIAQGPAPAPETQVGQKVESIPNAEKLQRSTEYLTQMRQGLRQVLTKLEEARAGKDVVKLNCVNEKLTNIKGLLRISEQADIALQEAVAKQEEQSAEHEFAKVTIARQKVDQLRAEVEQCVGLLAFETGNTIIDVVEPENLPQTDPTQSPPVQPVVTRPPPASPTS
jgi:TolA-binding protein